MFKRMCWLVFTSIWPNLVEENSTEKMPPSDCSAGKPRCILLMRESQDKVGDATPGQEVLGYIRRWVEQVLRGKPVSSSSL